MKIGFIVSFFDFRNDVRSVIAEVSKKKQVVIFGKPEHRQEILQHLPEGIEFRLIDERKNSFWNKLWVKLFVLLKQIPKSKHNFYLMELFKASITTDPVVRAKNYQILKWVRLLPKILSYDFYLNRLDYKANTDFKDIDQFAELVHLVHFDFEYSGNCGANDVGDLGISNVREDGVDQIGGIGY